MMINLILNTVDVCSMIKEAMRSSGANATKKHLEEVSLCAMFLLTFAKRVDRMLGVSQSVAHSIRDSTSDIKKMVSYLQSEGVTKEILQPDQQQQSFSFEDPSIAGMHKVSAGKLDPYLQGEIEMNPEEIGDDHLVDIDYELYDVS